MSSSDTLRVRALARAVELAGGTRELAAYLGIRPLTLSYFLHGASHVPEDLFLRVVDLLVQRNVAELIAARLEPVSSENG